MDTCDCEVKHPLQRDGTSQDERYPAALDPSYASVDERKLEDLLLFARSWADKLHYYNSENKKDGTWKPFIEKDVATLIAIISRKNVAKLKASYSSNVEKVKSQATLANFKKVFADIAVIASEIDGWYKNAVEGLALSTDLSIYIKSTLGPSFIKLAAIDKGATALSSAAALGDTNISLHKDWDLKYSTITANVLAYQGSTNKKKMLAALEQVDPLFDSFMQVMQKLTDKAEAYMNEVLNEYPYHTPHFGLLLAFLQVFGHVQDHANTLTQRHLDFYYREVLQLEPKDAVADTVHVLFELAKDVSTHLVSAGTVLKAGKDNTGVQLYYKTEKDIVVNTAKIKELKSLFFDNTAKEIYASPIANSKDGEGEELDKALPEWKPMGERQGSTRTMPDAQIGFAIASPQLFLAEGLRKITLTLTCDKTLPKGFVRKHLLLYLTSEKEWLRPKAKFKVTTSGSTLVIKIKIADDEAAVTAYNQEIHGGSYDTGYPVLKLVLKNKRSKYFDLENIRISKASIDVRVIGVKQLILQNDLSSLEPDKPFQPFGPIPSKGSSFYIGSEEVFFKKLSSLDLSLQWHEIPNDDLSTYYNDYKHTDVGISTGISNNQSFTATIKYLDKKKWQPLTAGSAAATDVPLFKDTASAAKTILLNDTSKFTRFTEEDEDLESFSNHVKRGFIKLELSGAEFQHRNFPVAMTKVAIKQSSATINPPYTPVIKSLSIDYTSSQELDDKVDAFYHIQPFGEAKRSLKGDTLLPLFQATDEDGKAIDQEGSLYIGLESLDPPQVLSLLFQLVEDSGDPLLKKPEVNWSYLVKNEWVRLLPVQVLTDTTNDLTTSGIVELDLPETAGNENTIVTTGLHWIRASVNENTAAIAKVLDIRTQAVRAVFTDNSNDPAHLAAPLPAGSIAKPEVRIPEIAAIAQPYSSFGGKVAEQDMEFYRRVSERLRHKKRAINIWDYERLVLEQFPAIYKVKCISHTGDCSEIEPGRVSVIVISNLRNQNLVNPLKPLTGINTLDEIQTYLAKNASMFARIKVENPVYEEIIVSFKVHFHTGIDKGYFKKELNKDIKKFLAPWAYDEGADISFGGKMHASYIINFIEERTYVDYLEDFKMFRSVNGVYDSTAPLEEIPASTAKTILVSAEQHVIS